MIRQASILIIVLLLFSTRSGAILPLPFSPEPPEIEMEQDDAMLWDPKSISGYQELYQNSQLREMELPHFGSQPNALGYQEETFSVPEELKDRVNFWKRIYSEFTTSQAVLHDAEYPEIIYDILDISSIMQENTLPYKRKMKLLNDKFKAEKKRLSQRLEGLQNHTIGPADLPMEFLPIYKKIEAMPDKQPFIAASKRIRAQVGQRDRIVRGFLFGGRYFGQLMEIFEKKGVPKELTRLALVESGFDLSARSKVGASGVFQFMRSTGKKFLRIDRAVDERNDPISAAWAAAELLRQNYAALGSWPLAITAYNHGREGVARAVRKVASNSLGEIIRKYKGHTFGFASANFYSEFLAIIQLEKEYRSHYGKLLVDTPLEVETWLVPNAAKFEELALACGIQQRHLASLNPALTDWVISGRGQVPQGYQMRVPNGKKESCSRDFQRSPLRSPRTAKGSDEDRTG